MSHLLTILTCKRSLIKLSTEFGSGDTCDGIESGNELEVLLGKPGPKQDMAFSEYRSGCVWLVLDTGAILKEKLFLRMHI